GDTDDGHARIVDLGGSFERAVAADADERDEVFVGDSLVNRLDSALLLVGVVAGGTQHGSAVQPNSAHVVPGKRVGGAVDDTLPAIVEAHNRHPVFSSAALDYRADGGVQAGAVSAPGEDSYSHGSNPSVRPCANPHPCRR